MKRLPITFWTGAFVALVCVAMVVLEASRSWGARTALLDQAERSATNLAHAMSEHADDTLRTADTCLFDLEERIETDGIGPAQLERLHRLMVDDARRLPQIDVISHYDERGNWVVNSQATKVRNINIADREYFVRHMQVADAGTYIGLPVISRASGRWIIPMTRRIDKPDGSFGGVVMAAVDMGYLSRFSGRFDVGRNGAIGLLSDRGVLLLRQPYSARSIGADVRSSQLFQAYQRGGRVAGTGTFVSPQDGQLRLNSYRPVENYPLFVTAALSREDIMARWRHDTLGRSAAVLVLTALLALFGNRLVRQMRRRLQVEAELRQTRDALATLNATLEKLALQDGLTGLANRRQFDVSLGNEFSRAMRQGAPLALAMIDVDHFKAYNDRYGHAAGDDCLRAVTEAVRLQTPRRAGDLAARYGGEELAVLLPNTDGEGALAVAERIRAAVENLALEHAGSPLGIVTISAGVATLVPRRGADHASTLLEAADRALYAAKAAGRNRVMRHGDTATPG
ncbi:diguanylate cyclase (GGDEF)-like protein [Pseudoduganella lurida]|uniref:diguanylate cyclase n=1 Tax=Pseudoduganella lurida TaxID=1036180 RepID=A0A562R5L6_9BURK|nr:sensor domain-containing diguanylate cyclase [Pseudoduganella lurida]TWI64351.1 diguanylate cyclase (GGDEF)-like protein [Pseudoduganella lurida]